MVNNISWNEIKYTSFDVVWELRSVDVCFLFNTVKDGGMYSARFYVRDGVCLVVCGVRNVRCDSFSFSDSFTVFSFNNVYRSALSNNCVVYPSLVASSGMSRFKRIPSKYHAISYFVGDSIKRMDGWSTVNGIPQEGFSYLKPYRISDAEDVGFAYNWCLDQYVTNWNSLCV